MENFAYATEIVQSCHKRGAPSVVLKLDYAKAFDSIDWGSLLPFEGAQLVREVILVRSPATAPENIAATRGDGVRK